MYKLVSVGIPTFNRPELLSLALGDILSQTYKNLEINISDNCSPGSETEEVVRGFMKLDRRIKYHKQIKPIAAWDNFRFVFEKSGGEYFMWATDDDRWDENFISQMVLLLESDRKCALAFSEPMLMDAKGSVLPEILESKIDTGGLKGIKCLRNVLINQNYNNEICGVFRKKILDSFSFPKFFGSDHLLLLHVATVGSIKKGPPGLFRLGLGGDGSSYETVIRAFGIQNSIQTIYFGYISQGLHIAKFFFNSDALKIWQKAALPFLILERLFLTKIYSYAIKRDFSRFVRDILRGDLKI